MSKKLILTLTVLLLLSIPVILLCWCFLVPQQYDGTFMGELKYKQARLEETAGPRLILVGGSSVAFGVDSRAVEAELPGYTVVNYGMYAALGTTVMLDLSEPCLGPGDLVVVIPEQQSQTLSDYFDAEIMWQGVDGAYDLLTRLNRDQLGQMLGELPRFAGQKFAWFLRGNPPETEGVYTRSVFNEWGDVESPLCRNNVMAGLWDANTPIRFEAEVLDQAFVDRLNAYAAAAEKQGARVYYGFCPMNALAVTGEATVEEFYELLLEKLELPLLGDPRDSVLEAGWFYDTNFHLNSSGKQLYTRLLVRQLKAELGDSSPTEISVPPMPEPEHTELWQGDDSHGVCFRYERQGDAWVITGLTETGLGRTQLTVPSTWEGLQVVALEGGAFAGAEKLETVTIQRNIRRIGDGAFAGCTGLQAIRLVQEKPSDCLVGQGLLEGTNAFIFVPQGSFGAYQTNYSWSIYGSRIRGEKMDTGPDLPGQEETLPAPAGREVTYHTNGGSLKTGTGETLTLAAASTHMRVNTAQGSRYMERPGYRLVGWNTAPDGSGTAVGLGSRVAYTPGLVLYAQWVPENAADDFTYTVADNEVTVTGYRGRGELCVIPETLEGRKVTRIAAGAFRNAELDTLVLPPTLFAVERDAFAGCTLRELYLWDSLYYIYDESFGDCPNLTTLHINAAKAPTYSGSYYDAFADKYDWLLSIRAERKLVLFSGSSGRYGYDSEMLMEAFPEYRVANMGVYAFTNAKPQLELIRQLMHPGDILLGAPEFDAVNFQFCTTDDLDIHFWAMMESNYDAVALLDLRGYANIFDSLREFLTVRLSMDAGDYSVSPRWFDDDGNRYDYETYNQYGDFILDRPNAPRDEIMKWGLADYTAGGFPVETVEALNRVYRGFLEDGVRVYFTYTPRNIRAITPESTPEARQELHEHLREHLIVPVISLIEESLYPGTCFYLIDSHLSTEAVTVRTQRIIRDLQAWLAEEERNP